MGIAPKECSDELQGTLEGVGGKEVDAFNHLCIQNSFPVSAGIDGVEFRDFVEHGSEAVPGVGGFGIAFVFPVQELGRSAPEGLNDALEAVSHFARRGLSPMGHVVGLLNGGSGIFPRTGDDFEALDGKVGWGRVRPLVMPVAYGDVLGRQINGAKGVVLAGFPFAQAGGFAVEQAVAPNPEGAPLLAQMIVNGPDLAGEEFGLVFAGASWAIGFAD